jgi:hypothetical protein
VTVLENDFVERIDRYERSAARSKVARELEPLSPELVLVADEDEAAGARLALPEPPSFEAWLRELRMRESWDDVEDERRPSRVAGVLFGIACALNGIVPVVLAAWLH